jgi:GT2 family glycosyltransferase
VVVPVFNARRYLPTTIPAIGEAIRRFGAAELVVVDNGSTDGSWEWLQGHRPTGSLVVRLPGATVGALRNHGARLGRGSILAFLDADCLIAPEYLEHACRALDGTPWAAVGSRYALPEHPHWIERTWEALHTPAADGERAYLNSGNLVVRRSAFEAIGGFDPGLESGEDAELGLRLRAAGQRVFENRAVRAVHLGNPRTLGEFFRRERWHGSGALGTARLAKVDKPLLMTLVHVIAIALGTGLAVLAPMGALARAALAAGAWFAAPLATVGYRCTAAGRFRGAAGGVLLYALYFTARAVALVRPAGRNR